MSRGTKSCLDFHLGGSVNSEHLIICPRIGDISQRSGSSESLLGNHFFFGSKKPRDFDLPTTYRIHGTGISTY